MAAEVGRMAPSEYLRSLGVDAYKRAYKKGLSLSALVTKEIRSERENEKLDGFELLLREADICTASDAAAGIWADEFDVFFKTEQTRALIPEFLSRIWRGVANRNNRSIFTSLDTPGSSATNPTVYSTTARADRQIAPAIPLAELIAITTGINAGSYEAFYLTDDAASQRMVRVAEAAEIPGAKLVGGDHIIKLHKYGRRIIESYEAMRRMRIDKVTLMIQRMAAQNETDKVAAVIDVLVNGDGNTGTAATSYNLTTLDPLATAGTLSLKGWLAFLMTFANPYMATVALGQNTTVLQMMLLNSGSANVPLAFMPTTIPVAKFRPINTGLDGSLGVGWTADAPSLKIVAADSRFAIERVFEIGGDIQEVENVIKTQTKEITLTEVEGYVKNDPGAAHVLDVNA